VISTFSGRFIGWNARGVITTKNIYAKQNKCAVTKKKTWRLHRKAVVRNGKLSGWRFAQERAIVGGRHSSSATSLPVPPSPGALVGELIVSCRSRPWWWLIKVQTGRYGACTLYWQPLHTVSSRMMWIVNIFNVFNFFY